MIFSLDHVGMAAWYDKAYDAYADAYIAWIVWIWCMILPICFKATQAQS